MTLTAGTKAVSATGIAINTTKEDVCAALVAAVMIAFLFSSRDPAVDAEASAQVDVDRKSVV